MDRGRTLRAIFPALVLVAALAAAGEALAQHVSARSEALSPNLAGLFPDDWSDAVLNPARIPDGHLAFGRVGLEGDGRWRNNGGARAGAGPLGVLVGWGRSARGDSDNRGEHVLVALRTGQADRAGVRYNQFHETRPAYDVNGRVIGLGLRAAAGDGWLADVQVELASLDGRAGKRNYRSGEVLLRQLGPERITTDPGWIMRMIRMRGGAGIGDFGGVGTYDDRFYWFDASLVQLHTLRVKRVLFAGAWSLRGSHHRLEPAPCVRDCDLASPPAGSSGISMDAAVETALPASISIRTGVALTVLRAGSAVDLPGAWRQAAFVTPVPFDRGIWVGLGWRPHPSITFDAATGGFTPDMTDSYMPFGVQASYRF